MKKLDNLIFLIRENIYRLLEESQKFSEGEEVETKEGQGIIRLSKHPFYSITLNRTGVTKSYHSEDIRPVEADFGKYDISDDNIEDKTIKESPAEDVIKLDGIITLDGDVFLTDVLSSLRGIEGVTTVGNKEHTGSEIYKSRLSIKIDPFPYGNQAQSRIEGIVIKQTLTIPGVKSFHKTRAEDVVEKETTYQNNNNTPVKDIEALKQEKLKFKISEIKINKPQQIISSGGPTNGINGFKNYINDLNKMNNYLKPLIEDKYNNNTGLGEELINKILNLQQKIDNKYNIGFQYDYFKEWLDEFKDEIGLPERSSGSFHTAFFDEDQYDIDVLAEIFNISENDADKLWGKNYNK